MSTGSQQESPAPQAPRSAGDLAASWRRRAAQLRKRASQLGDCRRGLEAFTESCVLNDCAQQLEEISRRRRGS